MIQCPECGKDIADDVAHCGYCGAQVETAAGKKTMIGFAAVTDETLRQAAEQAKQARETAENAADQAAGGESSEGKLKLPKPNLPSPAKPAGSARGPGGKLNIPRPGGADPTDSSDSGVGDPQAPSDAKTEIMSPVSTDAEQAGAPDAGALPVRPDAAPTAPETPSRRAFANADVADTDPEAFHGDGDGASAPTEPPLPGSAEADEPAWSSTGDEKTMPEVAPAVAGGGPTALSGPDSPTGPSEFGGAALTPAGNTLPEKKKNPLVIAALIMAALIAVCCIATIAFMVIPPLL